MRILYNPNTGDVTVSFESALERKGCSATLKEVLEREKRRRVIPVPVCENGFFEKIRDARETMHVVFFSEYLLFLIVFLREICVEMKLRDTITREIERAISLLEKNCSRAETLQ